MCKNTSYASVVVYRKSRDYSSRGKYARVGHRGSGGRGRCACIAERDPNPHRAPYVQLFINL